MLPRAFCMAKALECELNAGQVADPTTAREWLRMANEWRLAAVGAPSAADGGEHAPDVTHEIQRQEGLGQDR